MKSFSYKIEQQKNYEYRDSYRWVLTSLVVMLIVSVILSAAVAYKAIFPGQIKYYASMTTGQVIPLPTLSEPVVTDKYLLEWASLATRAALNLDFVNYQKQMQDASIYFTDRGWDGFSKALEDSGLLETVKSKKLLMNAIIPGPPVIGFSGIVSGRHVWRVTMPVLVTFGSASDERQRRFMVSLVISRVPAVDTPTGIQITDFEAKTP